MRSHRVGKQRAVGGDSRLNGWRLNSRSWLGGRDGGDLSIGGFRVRGGRGGLGGWRLSSRRNLSNRRFGSW